MCETVIISPPSYLSSQVPGLIISILSTNTSEDDAARTQRAASSLEMANIDSHVSRVPDTCGDSNIYGHGNLISQIYICLDQFYIKWMQGARPPRIFKPIQKRRGKKEEWKKPLPSCCGSSRSWSPVSLCWPYGQSWEPSTGHCTQGIFWSQGSISPLGWTWLGTQIHTPRVSAVVAHLFCQY